MKQLKFLPLLLSLVLPLCGNDKISMDLVKIADHAAKKTKDPWTWVFYGDSITHGASHTWGWRSFPEIFHERVRWEYHLSNDAVINSGRSGNTTFDLLNEAQYQRRVRRYTPQVVFVLIGCNDIVHGKCGGAEGFRSRLENLVQRIQKDGAIVVLQTYNTINAKLWWGKKNPYVQRLLAFPEFNQVIRDTAVKYNTILVDHEKYWKKHASSPAILQEWLGEYIHPGAKGHLEMAKLILKTLNLYDENSRCCHVNACNPPKPPKKQ